MIPGFDELWLPGADERRHVSEVVVTLTLPAHERVHEPAANPAALRTPWPGQRFTPGGEWLSMKLYLPFDGMDGIIDRLVDDQLDGPAAALSDQWFYLRYADPEPHLRIRAHARSAETVRDQLAAWTGWAGSLAE